MDQRSVHTVMRFDYESPDALQEDVESPFVHVDDVLKHVILATYLNDCRKEGKNHFILAAHNVEPALELATQLQAVSGVVVHTLDEPDALRSLLNPRTALVLISAADGLTGLVQPLEEIRTLCAAIPLAIEATHAWPKFPVTANILIVGSALAVEPGFERFLPRRGKQVAYPETRAPFNLHIAPLRDEFEQLVLQRIPKSAVLFKESSRLPNVSVLTFEGLHGDALACRLRNRDFALSDCQHLHRRGVKSHAISLSWGLNSRREELLPLLDALQEEVAKLRIISGYVE